jgi:hypothetical protein
VSPLLSRTHPFQSSPSVQFAGPRKHLQLAIGRQIPGAEQAYSLRLECAPAAADTPVPDIQADGTGARLCFHANHAVTLNRIQGG